MWNGFATTVTARLVNGLLVQAGVDRGSLTLDTCDLRAALPETAPVNPYCHTEEPATQFKMLGAYTIPRIALQVSATLQSLPGPDLAANFTATSASIAPSLGRNLAAGAGATVSVNLVEPGTLYGQRLNQLDLRLARVIRFGGASATLNLDLYNALNVDTVLTASTAYATWQRPQSIMLARFAKLGLQLDF